MLKVIAINADGAYSVNLWTDKFEKIYERVKRIAESNNVKYINNSLIYNGIINKQAAVGFKFESKEDMKNFLRDIRNFKKSQKK